MEFTEFWRLEYDIAGLDRAVNVAVGVIFPRPVDHEQAYRECRAMCQRLSVGTDQALLNSIFPWTLLPRLLGGMKVEWGPATASWAPKVVLIATPHGAITSNK